MYKLHVFMHAPQRTNTMVYASLARCLCTFSLLRNLIDWCSKSRNMSDVNCGCNAEINRMVIIKNAPKNGKCVHVGSDHQSPHSSLHR